MKYIKKVLSIFIICLLAIIFIIIIGMLVLSIGSDIKNKCNRIDSGIVIDKEHHDAYSYMTKFGRVHNPEKYIITISGEKNNKYVEYSFECTKADYESYNIGDKYPK